MKDSNSERQVAQALGEVLMNEKQKDQVKGASL